MIYLYLFGTCFHFIYVFMIIGKYYYYLLFFAVCIFCCLSFSLLRIHGLYLLFKIILSIKIVSDDK